MSTKFNFSQWWSDNGHRFNNPVSAKFAAEDLVMAALAPTERQYSHDETMALCDQVESREPINRRKHDEFVQFASKAYTIKQ